MTGNGVNRFAPSQKSKVKSQKYYPIDESRGLKSGKHFFISTDKSGGLYPVYIFGQVNA